MANQPETVPFHIRTEPFKKDYQDNILIEIAIYLMKHAKGNFDPENVTLKVNTQRGLYTAWLPQVLVDLLVEMPAPKKFPAHLCTNATFHFLPWKPEAVRLWMTIAQPESAPSIPTTILKITLNNILNNHGLAITELKPNLSKNTDVKCLTGVYYVSLNYNKDLLRDSSDTSTLEDLKHITIKEAHCKVELSNTVTHKLDLCTKCYRPLPKDHPAVLNKPTLLDQQADEDKTISDERCGFAAGSVGSLAGGYSSSLVRFASMALKVSIALEVGARLRFGIARHSWCMAVLMYVRMRPTTKRHTTASTHRAPTRATRARARSSEQHGENSIPYARTAPTVTVHANARTAHAP